MVYDGHIHIGRGEINKKRLEDRMKAAGVDGGVLLSLPPAAFYPNGMAETAEERLDNLFSWVGDDPELFPFYWIDPIEGDALDQVDLACKRGVKGFKIICSRFFPSDKRALSVYQSIASNNKPILFHSGILWDGNPSSQYNRPVEFEALMEVKGLRFALAHISWPWCDENIAVFGKIQHALTHRPELSAEMYIDITPGTPPIYRKEALTKLFTVGYRVADNVLFGIDCMANDYDAGLVKDWMTIDNNIYHELGLEPDSIAKIYGKNLMRFINGNGVEL